jgi:hypothetical protein
VKGELLAQLGFLEAYISATFSSKFNAFPQKGALGARREAGSRFEPPELTGL